MSSVFKFLFILLLVLNLFAASSNNMTDSETSNKEVEMCPTPRCESRMHFELETDGFLDKPSLVTWDKKHRKFVKHFINMEKNVFEATPLFKSSSQDLYCFIHCDDRIKKYSTVYLRDQGIDFIDPKNSEKSIDNIDHMVNMQLILNVFLRGAVYCQLNMETNEVSILFVSQIKDPIFSKELAGLSNIWQKKEFLTMSVNCIERNEYLYLDKIYHCCKQVYHPKEVVTDKGKIKYLLVPLSEVKGFFVLDKIQLRCLKNKVNSVKKYLNQLKDLYDNKSPDFNERYWKQWNDFVT